MGTFVVTIVTLLLVVSVYRVKAGSCDDFKHTNCSSCVKKGGDCYWCPDTGECGQWDLNKTPDCKRSKYFYKQCNLNGAAFIVLFSSAAFILLLVVILSCCIFCCCCLRRRRRRQYVSLAIIERTDMRNRPLRARRDEIRHKYGLDTNDSTV